MLTMAVDVEFDEAIQTLCELGNRFSALVESIPDGARRAGGLEWTLAETAVHVWRSFDYYAASIKGERIVESSPAPGESFSEYVARENRAQIDAEPERDVAKIARALPSSIDNFVEVARKVGPGAAATFAASYTEESTTSVCALVCELVVHGYDIAHTFGAKWDVGPRAAVLAVYSTSAALGLGLDKAAAANTDIHVGIRLRHGSPFSIRIRDGEAWCEVTEDKPDVHVLADPLAYLMVGFGRMPVLRPLLRGKLLVWGRKPWLLLTVPKLFQA